MKRIHWPEPYVPPFNLWNAPRLEEKEKWEEEDDNRAGFVERSAAIKRMTRPSDKQQALERILSGRGA